MEISTGKPTIIDKESVSGLKFPKEEVLKSSEAILQRKLDLERATTLGNIERDKRRIIFQDADGLKQIETTIWAVTDQRIILKQGMVIPIHCIHEVKI